MRMTCLSSCNIYENVDMIRYEAFVIMAERKGATVSVGVKTGGSRVGGPELCV